MTSKAAAREVRLDGREGRREGIFNYSGDRQEGAKKEEGRTMGGRESRKFIVWKLRIQ